MDIRKEADMAGKLYLCATPIGDRKILHTEY